MIQWGIFANSEVKTLEEISGSYLTYLLTSSPGDVALEKLAALGVEPQSFDFRVYSDTPGAGQKNSGEAFEYALRRAGEAPDKHLYIGDRLKSDIRPANNLGMQTLAVWSFIPEATDSVGHIHDIREVLL